MILIPAFVAIALGIAALMQLAHTRIDSSNRLDEVIDRLTRGDVGDGVTPFPFACPRYRERK
jgi:hypothetical protein